MRLIVADAYGSGQLRDKDDVLHDLSPDDWTEVDVRDDIITGAEQTAWVRYREDGRTVEVPAETTYHAEYRSENVIDVRAATPAVAALIDAMEGFGTDEDQLFRALESVSGNRPAIEQVYSLFEHQTGRSLDDAFESELSGDDLARAREILAR